MSRLLARVTFVAGTCCATACAVASCTSDEGSEPPPEADAGNEEAPPPTTTEPVDAGVHVEHPDAAPFDGGPRDVVCESSRCATALVTTLGANANDRAEGFCALLNDGTVACWGANGGGQLGRGDDAGSLDGPSAERVVGIEGATRLDHTCALDKTGAVRCWGTGPHLRDGGGTITTDRTPVTLPLAPVATMGIGAEVGCAVVDEGIVCWGRNFHGQVAPFTSSAPGTALAPAPVDLPLGAPIRALVVSKASFVLREDGTLVSWGANPPLGRLSSLFPDPTPTPIDLAGVSSLDSSYESACATVAGIGYCWGDIVERLHEYVNPAAPRIDRALPEPVVTPEPIVRIATTRSMYTRGTYGIMFTTPQRWCAVGASGAIYCWGFNESGQAGDGTKLDVLSDAVKVQGLPGPAADVKTTPNATCALLTSGKVYCWGSNYYGQLGSGNLKVPSLTPQEVALP